MTRTNRVLNGHNKAGFHSGRLHAHNIIAGKVDVTLGSGDGTATVTFARPLANKNYRVLLLPQESTTNDDLTICVTAKTPQSFLITVTSTNHSSPITISNHGNHATYKIFGSEITRMNSEFTLKILTAGCFCVG